MSGERLTKKLYEADVREVTIWTQKRVQRKDTGTEKCLNKGP